MSNSTSWGNVCSHHLQARPPIATFRTHHLWCRDVHSAGNSDASRDRPVPNTNLDALLELPQLSVAQEKRSQKTQSLVDYLKSILLTSSQYLETMELKVQRKEEATCEAARRKELAAQKQLLRDAEQQRKEEDKCREAEEARVREAFRQCWTKEAIRESGERLQALMCNPPPLPPPGSQIVPF